MPKDYQKLSSVAQSEHQPDAPSGEGPPPVVKKEFDPTAWYVYGVKRNKEIETCSFFNDSQNIPFAIEAYASVQQKKVRTYPIAKIRKKSSVS